MPCLEEFIAPTLQVPAVHDWHPNTIAQNWSYRRLVAVYPRYAWIPLGRRRMATVPYTPFFADLTIDADYRKARPSTRSHKSQPASQLSQRLTIIIKGFKASRPPPPGGIANWRPICPLIENSIVNTSHYTASPADEATQKSAASRG